MPRRLAITGQRRIEFLEYEEEPLQSRQVRVKTELATSKHGTMLPIYRRDTPSKLRFDGDLRLFVPGDEERIWWQFGPKEGEPFSFGTGGVGTIIEVGPEVTRWKLGDKVFGHMDIRETNTCQEDGLFILGDIPPDEALCVEPAYVSFHCVREGGVHVGDTVAVVGLGAIGMIAVKLARLSGAIKVFAIDPVKARRDWCLCNGADYVFDPTTNDAALEVHKITDKHGVDVAIETAGSYLALQTAIRCARLCGAVVSAGFYQGEAKGLFLGQEWHHNRLTIVVPHGCYFGHPPRDYPRWDERRAEETLVELLRTRRLTLPGLVSPIISMDEVPEMFRKIDSGAGEIVKFGVKF